MRIGDAAAAAGTTPRALRFYEQRGLLPPASRTATGQRRYGPRDVARVRLIRRLLSVGLTVEDVRGCLADPVVVFDGDTLPPCDAPECAFTQTSAIIERRLDVLNAEISRLAGLRDQLREAVGHGVAAR
ncbi:MerR family transcriptional regulator [Nonomuraea glycinis]|uniref:MerR family transcriptional regulator n=1 Tax=Nonomuraea glycinis TaxID=2047744 RepID=A0A918E327_9ACTN|nr:MerR family transcriptional regulator [Nonomuraea glycinis]MCA2180356.1 MerR family transcriptional regulator [Nonomuraea glycinis]GGP04059.1 MerR family transcriptional regulator [Nonomuraea glycinis]